MNCYNHALYLLSRREHSSKELKDKLIQKGHDPSDVISVIDDLQAKKLQSDQRFIESMIRVRIGQGKGPRWILNELSQHLLPKDTLLSAIYDPEHDWGALAIAARDQKFGLAKPQDYAHKAKQQRFLQYRGFENEHIALALNTENTLS